MQTELTEKQIKAIHDSSEQLKSQLSARSLNDCNERKSLTTTMRIEIANNIIANYSMLKKDKGIFHSQLFSAMDDYLKACNDTGYKII